MFNGIIKHIGKINKINTKRNYSRIEIFSKMKFSRSDIGSSISCSGTCLTLEEYRGNLGCFYISKETLNRTNFKFSKKTIISTLKNHLNLEILYQGILFKAMLILQAKLKKLIVLVNPGLLILN